MSHFSVICLLEPAVKVGIIRWQSSSNDEGMMAARVWEADVSQFWEFCIQNAAVWCIFYAVPQLPPPQQILWVSCEILEFSVHL